MIGVIILVVFVIGWFSGITAYKYKIKNSPVDLPLKSRYDAIREIEARKWAQREIEYQGMLKEYHRQSAELKKMRDEFYKKNPDFPIKTMYMQVTAPPQKISVTIID